MDIKKLQKVVVDALEDVKAQDIKIFDTTHLTSLFDRVAIASGTSSRQTKALAASVRDKVKSTGGKIVSIEGENTGEWVLVDLGDMVVHIMQPTIRAYYHLEEIWGDKPVSLTAPKRAKAPKKTPTVAVQTETPTKKRAPRKTASKTASKTAAPKKTAATQTAKKTAVKKTAAKKPTAKTTTSKPKLATKKAPAKKTVAAKKSAK